MPPLDGFDIFGAITTGAPSPRQEHIYNVDCERPLSAKTCAEAGSPPIGAIRDAVGLKLLVGPAGPAAKSAVEQIPNWTVDAEEMSLLQWAGVCALRPLRDFCIMRAIILSCKETEAQSAHGG